MLFIKFLHFSIPMNSCTKHKGNTDKTKTQIDSAPPAENQTAKLSHLNQIEKFENFDITVDRTRPKYFITFPYPYMNGKLHLGHLYSFSKADFTAYFKRLEGYNVLLPFAFHCTGMPISASAYKLTEELENRPVDVSVADILRGFGFTNLKSFTNPVHWIQTFPGYAIKTLKDYGACIDWKRSFITTNINPYYDSFICFQFNRLKRLGYLNFGKRYSIYCTIVEQACLDHDRRKGEGVKPVEAILRKIPVAGGTLLVRCKSPRVPSKVVISRGQVLDRVSVEDKTFYLEEKLSSNLEHQTSNYKLLESGCRVEFHSESVRIEYTDADIPMKLVYGENEIDDSEYREISDRKNETMRLVESESFVKIYEPESTVISRSGSTCVVSLLDQWFIDYGNEAWKAKARDCVNRMDITEAMRSSLLGSVDWINKWGFSRSFGLGTKIPWDKKYLIESLSDSTIYMAFYTIKHFLYTGLEGKEEIFPASLLSDCVWSYIFSDVLASESPLNDDAVVLDAALLKYKDILDSCRESLNYFYPVDLRVSAKDLVTNHLTFFIFNHVALFKDAYWPRKIFTNGYAMLNSAKMSKSDGNFLSGEDALAKYGASATRMALALCGDTTEDANFEESVANACILKLHTFVKAVEDLQTAPPSSRDPAEMLADMRLEDDFLDSWFLSQIGLNLKTTIDAYRNMLFRDVMKFGFYENLHAIELYAALGGRNNALLNCVYKSVLQIMYPIVPGVSKHLLELKFDSEIRLPAIPAIDSSKIDAISHLKAICKQILAGSRNKKGVEMIVGREYPDWKIACMKVVDAKKEILFNETERKNAIIEDVRPILAGASTSEKRGVLFCMDYLKNPLSHEIKFDEYDLFTRFRGYIEDVTKLSVTVSLGKEGEPLSPALRFN